jgi:oligosaccharide repeat unit polymerase
MSLVSLFCFSIAFLIVLSCFRRGADIFSPARVFGFVWAIAIGLTDLKLSRLQHPWENYAWICLMIGVLSFLLGILMVNIIIFRCPRYSVNQIRTIVYFKDISSTVLFRFILIFFILYSVVYLIEWNKYGTLPLFASYPDRARSEIPIFGIHLLIGGMPIILFLIIEYFIIVPSQIKKKLLLAVLFLIVLLSYFFLLNRFYYVLFFIVTLVFAYYTSRYIRFKNVLFAFILLVSLLAFLQYFRETRYVENFLYVVSGMKYSKTYAALTGPYMYIVMNLENFARAVVRLENFTYGYFSFDFFMALTGLKHWLSGYFGLQERVFLVSGYNTFPFFWDFYYDFGLIGLMLLSCLLGMMSSILHLYMRFKPSIVSIALYSMMLFVIIFSFFTNALTSLNFVFNFGLLFFSQKLIQKKNVHSSKVHDSIVYASNSSR